MTWTQHLAVCRRPQCRGECLDAWRDSTQCRGERVPLVCASVPCLPLVAQDWDGRLPRGPESRSKRLARDREHMARRTGVRPERWQRQPDPERAAR